MMSEAFLLHVTGIGELKHKRNELDKQIAEEEAQQAGIQKDVKELTKLLSNSKEILTQKASTDSGSLHL